MRLTAAVVRELTIELALIVVGTIEVVFCYQHIALLTVLLAVMSAVALCVFRSWLNVLVYGVGAVVGSSVEIVCSGAGAWHYAQPSFLGIPLWLPVAWGFAPVMMLAIAETLRKAIQPAVDRGHGSA